MILAAVFSLVLGVFCGLFLFQPQLTAFFSEASDYILLILMFSVGISVGANKTVFEKLRQHSFKILFLPVTIIAGSLAGGVVCSFLLGDSFKTALSIASGMGWYSLSGVMLTELLGADVGTIAFLANMMREIFAFLLIPVLIHYADAYTAIAPAGATSEDTSLPVLIRYAGEDAVVIAVINGMLCSAAVPVLINFFCKFL